VRKRIATYGKRGHLVRVDDVTEGGVRKYEVITGSKANRSQVSFAGTPKGRTEAMAYAEGYDAEARKPKAPDAPVAVTTRALWLAYAVVLVLALVWASRLATGDGEGE
jgi:hypothetical protein